MKKIIIGRGNDSDIVIPDERDNVSRHHAILSFDFLGHMTLTDTSSNGTFMNDKRIEKDKPVGVSRKDKIRLGDAWQFDWHLVTDPYRKWRILCLAALLLVALAAVGFFVFKPAAPTPEEKTPVVAPAHTTTADTTKAKEPDSVATAKTTKGKQAKKGKGKRKKKKNVRRKKTAGGGYYNIEVEFLDEDSAMEYPEYDYSGEKN